MSTTTKRKAKSKDKFPLGRRPDGCYQKRVNGHRAREHGGS